MNHLLKKSSTFLGTASFAALLTKKVHAATIGEQVTNHATNAGFPINTADNVLGNILLWLALIITLVAVIAFLVYGIMFIASGANKDLAEKAKNGVTYSIIGIVVALSAYIIIKLIFQLLTVAETA